MAINPMGKNVLDTVRNYYKVTEFEAEYPAEVTDARMHMACGLTKALKDEDEWPRWVSNILFANDFVLISTRWSDPRNNIKGYPFVVAPSEVHEKNWRRGDNPYYMRDTAEYMLAFMSNES